MSRPLLAEYVSHGWVLVPIPLGMKKAITVGWNIKKNGITDEEIAEHMDGNVGLAHAYSGTCCIDLDDLVTASEWLGFRSVNIQDLIDAPDTVRISSGRDNRAKLLYKLSVPLPSFSLPGFELRCATRNGLTVQDVLPPSIHPDTGNPYEWIGDWTQLPELPETVLALWKSLITPDTKIQKPRAKVSINLGRARELVFRHSPDVTYSQWIDVGMALHHETNGSLAGFDLWDEWSARGSKYKGREDLDIHWRSFRTTAENPRTLSSLRIDEAATADEFEIVKPADRVVPTPAKKVATTAAEVKQLLRYDNNGVALSTLPNVVTILSVPTVYGYEIAYDSFKDVLVATPHGEVSWQPINDTYYTSTRLWLENTARFNPVSREMVRDAIYYLAEVNKMDTAQLWLDSLAWDGVERVQNFMPRYMGTAAGKYERSVGLYMWTALAGRIMDPGCPADMVPILIGNQGLGKSTGIAAMVPDPDYFVEIRLDEPDDQIARKMRGVLIGEIAEMRGLRTQDLERIKSFVTRKHEKWIPKYQEFATTFARRCLMVGTSNDDELFVDTENRRWLPVRTAGVDVPAIKRDRDQLWAEALIIFKKDGVHWQKAEELGKEEHQEFKAVDAWSSVIGQWLNDNANADCLKLHDVLVQAVGIDIRHLSRAHELRAANVLRSLGFEKKVVRPHGKVWVRRSGDLAA